MEDWNAVCVKHMHARFHVQQEDMYLRRIWVLQFTTMEITHVLWCNRYRELKRWRFFREKPDMKPSQVHSTAILHDIRQRKPWQDITKAAKSFGNKKWLSNPKQKIKSETQLWWPSILIAILHKYITRKRKILTDFI